MIERKLFTSESVSEGHPDKICDQISDAILDAILKEDKNARVACETFVTTEKVIVGGEINTNVKVDYEKIVRETLKEIGYTHKDIGIGYDTCDIDILIHEQSADISRGVNKEEIGAGDQGIMFGYACSETSTYMPLAITIANDLVKEATKRRKNGSFKHARPDMKTQVTIDYTEETPSVHTVLFSCQHDDDFNEVEFKDYIENEIVKSVLDKFNIDYSNYKMIINPTGRFVTGGPDGDAGLTGRKIIVDTYGGYARHGGGAFSGKDATKVDRSAAYMSRYIAKNIVASGLASECEIQLSYAIGLSEPISVMVETFGTNTVEIDIILKSIRNEFDLTPYGIIKTLGLDQPIFKGTATYGHMGREDLGVSWEKTDKVTDLKKYL